MPKILFFILAIFSLQVLGQDKWDLANMNVVRLPPAEFSQLPVEVATDLQARGCTIPQTYLAKEKHNVIEGEFGKSGQKDWAVLCSRFQVSSILVYWNGSADGVASIAESDDRDFLQGEGEELIGFTRGIGIANAEYIWDHYNAYGGPLPPKIEYQGINDIFGEKASTVWYFHNGRWLELQGAD